MKTFSSARVLRCDVFKHECVTWYMFSSARVLHLSEPPQVKSYIATWASPTKAISIASFRLLPSLNASTGSWPFDLSPSAFSNLRTWDGAISTGFPDSWRNNAYCYTKIFPAKSGQEFTPQSIGPFKCYVTNCDVCYAIIALIRTVASYVQYLSV